jgi:hypothetical protein
MSLVIPSGQLFEEKPEGTAVSVVLAILVVGLTACGLQRRRSYDYGGNPTADELTAMVDAKAVLNWAGYAVDDLAETTVPGSSLKHLGLQPTSLPRVVGMFSEDDLEATLTTWTVPVAGGPARAPTMAESEMAKLFFRLCQLVAGAGLRLQELKAVAKAAPAVAAPPTVQSSSAQGQRIKLCSVISQVDNSERSSNTMSNAMVAMRRSSEQARGRPRTVSRQLNNCLGADPSHLYGSA